MRRIEQAEPIRKRILPLLAILILALVLRVWHLQYGLPQILHPDEPTLLQPALRIADPAHFDPDPKFFNYPSLQIYVLSLCFFVEGILSQGGSPSRPALPDVLGAAHVGRWLTTLFGVATVAVVYLLVSRHSSRRKGLVAALLLAVTPLHALDSHYTNVDIPMTFWLLLACLLALDAARDGKTTRFLFAAAALGFAGATKYTALAAFPLLPAATLLSTGPIKRPWTRSRRSAAGLAVCARAFLLAAPYTLLRFQDVLGAIRFEQSHVQGGHWGFDLDPGGLVYHRLLAAVLSACRA